MLRSDVSATKLLAASALRNARGRMYVMYNDDDDHTREDFAVKFVRQHDDAYRRLCDYVKWANVSGAAPVLLQMGRRFQVPHDVLNIIASMTFRNADPKRSPLQRPDKR